MFVMSAAVLLLGERSEQSPNVKGAPVSHDVGGVCELLIGYAAIGSGTTDTALLSSIKQSEQSSNRTILSGPVLPSISEWYRTSKWRVSGGLGEIFKAACITTSIKLEGRKRLTPEATFHSLRHTFVSFAANAGVPLHVVQSIVGHESTAMTRHYYHENLTALKSAVAAIPTL